MYLIKQWYYWPSGVAMHKYFENTDGTDSQTATILNMTRGRLLRLARAKPAASA